MFRLLMHLLSVITSVILVQVKLANNVSENKLSSAVLILIYKQIHRVTLQELSLTVLMGMTGPVSWVAILSSSSWNDKTVKYF